MATTATGSTTRKIDYKSLKSKAWNGYDTDQGYATMSMPTSISTWTWILTRRKQQKQTHKRDRRPGRSPNEQPAKARGTTAKGTTTTARANPSSPKSTKDGQSRPTEAALEENFSRRPQTNNPWLDEGDDDLLSDFEDDMHTAAERLSDDHMLSGEVRQERLFV